MKIFLRMVISSLLLEYTMHRSMVNMILILSMQSHCLSSLSQKSLVSMQMLLLPKIWMRRKLPLLLFCLLNHHQEMVVILIKRPQLMLLLTISWRKFPKHMMLKLLRRSIQSDTSSQWTLCWLKNLLDLMLWSTQSVHHSLTSREQLRVRSCYHHNSKELLIRSLTVKYLPFGSRSATHH